MPRRLPPKPRIESEPAEFYRKMYNETRAMRKEALEKGAHTAVARYQAMLTDLYEKFPRDEGGLGLDELSDQQLCNLIIEMSNQIPDQLAQDLFVHLADRLHYPLGPRLVEGDG